VFYYVSKLAGYDHTDCAYSNIGDAFSPLCKFMVLRTTAALFGALTAPLMYGIARRFGSSVNGAILASLFFVVDGLNLIESRLILIDSQLIFWCAASLYLATHWWERWNLHWSAVDEWEAATGRTLSWAHQLGFPLPSPQDSHLLQTLWADQRVMSLTARLMWVVAVGVVCANAVSIKFTGLASPGMVAVESFFAAFFLRRAIPITDLLLVAAVAFATFSAYYAVHFSLLPLSGDGDGFMHLDFQRTLINNSNYDPAAPHPSFWRMLYEVGGVGTGGGGGELRRWSPASVVDCAYCAGVAHAAPAITAHVLFLTLHPHSSRQLNTEMVSASARIEQRHHWDSTWNEWPANVRGVLYYSKDKGHTTSEMVYLLGERAHRTGGGGRHGQCARFTINRPRSRLTPGHRTRRESVGDMARAGAVGRCGGGAGGVGTHANRQPPTCRRAPNTSPPRWCTAWAATC